MLEFINNNGVLFSGIFGLVTALITAIIAIVVDKRKDKKDTVSSLKRELTEAKVKLDHYSSIEIAESKISKGDGAIYRETLPNGNTRSICGYCWEKEHVKIPIVVNQRYDEYDKQSFYSGYCEVCKSRCIENITPAQCVRHAEDDEDNSYLYY